MIYQELLKKISQKTLGHSVVESMIAEDGSLTFKSYRKHRRRLKKLKKKSGQRKKQLQTLQRSCADHIQTVTSPLALISQIQRSGGSLLSQLFDGHPEIHAHPHELKIGFPTKYTWPKLDLNENLFQKPGKFLPSGCFSVDISIPIILGFTCAQVRQTFSESGIS